MKTVLIKIMAVLLIVWYSMSIIGFGVHTCSGSGRIFVTSFIEGTTCEDIHPEDVCEPSSCCGHAHEHEAGISIKSMSCCSNDYQVLQLTGTSQSDDNRSYDGCAHGFSPFVTSLSYDAVNSAVFKNTALSVHKPDSGQYTYSDRQAAFGIWRI